MLPQQYRLKKKKDFERVFKKGKGLKETFLFLKFKKNKLQESRFGFLVSQKVSKKAVERNKVKRRLRELIRLKLPEIKKGIDIVLITKPGLEKKNFQEMEEMVNKLFKKAKLFND